MEGPSGGGAASLPAAAGQPPGTAGLQPAVPLQAPWSCAGAVPGVAALRGVAGARGGVGVRAARSRGGAARWLRPPAARWSWGLGRRAAWFITAPILGLGGRGLLCFASAG